MSEYLILKQYNLVIIRYAEIWLKSQKVKIRMLKTLMDNIKIILNREGIPFNKYQISKDSSRVFFFFNNDYIERAITLLLNAFGIHSLSPTIRTSSNLKNIEERALEIANEVLEIGDTFALRVKRSGKHSFSSLDVAKIIGKSIIETFPEKNLKVNLTTPKKQIFIEVRQDFAYVFTEIIKSKWGGLPIEHYKKLIVMDIGKVNDLAAGFLLMRRGCEIYPILFDVSNNKENEEQWVFNWKKLKPYIPLKHFSMIKIILTNILKEINKNQATKSYLCGLCRMVRFEIISRLSKADSLKTFDFKKIRAISDGLSLNSNTLCNDVVDLESISLNHLFNIYPIFTPLVGFNSKENEEILQKISKDLNNFDYCRFKPQNQKFDYTDLENIYFKLNINSLINESINNLHKITIF